MKNIDIFQMYTGWDINGLVDNCSDWNFIGYSDNRTVGKASNAKRSGVVCKSGGGGFGCNSVREKMEGRGRI